MMDQILATWSISHLARVWSHVTANSFKLCRVLLDILLPRSKQVDVVCMSLDTSQ